MNNDVILVERIDLRDQLAKALAEYRCPGVRMDGSHNPTPGEYAFANFLARAIHNS